MRRTAAARCPALSRSTRPNIGGKRRNHAEGQAGAPDGPRSGRKGGRGGGQGSRDQHGQRGSGRRDGLRHATELRRQPCGSRSSKVYTDQHRAYQGAPFDHETVNHSVSEYVRDQAHTQGIESFWATLKRAYHGTYHHLSPKHLQRYVSEFAAKHNIRDRDTIDQMNAVVAGMVGKRLMYRDLTS